MYKYSILFFCMFLVFSCDNSSTTSSEKEAAAPVFDTKAAFKQYERLKPSLRTAIAEHKLTEKLKEEIEIYQFNLGEIEIAEAQLWYQKKELKGIDTDYFDGAPIGTKHWYCEGEKIVAVEVAAYQQDTAGAVYEKPLYTILFDPQADNDHLVPKTEDFNTKFVPALFKENRKEWLFLKQLAEKYKPQK